MSNDNLGDRMKAYESSSSISLTTKIPVIIRLDGSAFHTLTRKMAKPYDEKLRACMDYATVKLCERISGVKFAYNQSDEISLFLSDMEDIKTEGWFGYKKSKVESVSAAMCTAYFNEELKRQFPDLGPAFFDSRSWNLPKEEVCNAFLWRQQDCTRNSISMLARSHFSHKEVMGKSSAEMQDMLMLGKSINWNDQPVFFKRGTAFYKVQKEVPNPYDGKELVIRNTWFVDKDMPILTKDRNFVNKWIPGYDTQETSK